MKYIFALLLFSSSLIYSQDDFVIIKFQNLELLESGWKEGAVFSFKINGIEIQPDTIQYSISVNNRRLDTVCFSMDGIFNKKNRAFTKFKKNETYIIKINPCSQYELFPEIDAQIGSVEFLSKREKENLQIEFCMESIFFNKANSRKIISCIPSAMCRFSKKEIKIIENDELLDSFYFHFLHGEKLQVKLFDKKLNFKVKKRLKD